MPDFKPIEIIVKKPKAFKRRYEFYDNEKEVAVLDYEKGYKSCAVAYIENNKWKLRRGGWWKSYLEITAEQSPYTKTRLYYKWNWKTTFRADNGKEFLLKNTSAWKSKWAWFDENKIPVVDMKSCQLKRDKRGIIIINATRPIPKELYLLMLIGWYQVTGHESSAGAMAAISAGASAG